MKYKYASLPIQADNQSGLFAIRLLHLLPDTNRDSSLQCQLIETHIPDYYRGKSTTPQGTRHVQYQALSYTWGEPVFIKTLYVLKGTESAGDINITENLHSALQNLREPDKILVLWVDAVCIDQSNIPERNS
jgi:Heterokaryon incompatibility protein (HET)